MKIINKTNSMQSVEFVDGRYITLRPDEEFEFKENEVYDFELERVKKVFRVAEVEEKINVEKPKATLKKVKIEMPDNEYGVEVE